ncbi:MAG: TonB family protein [Chitinispirillaceae bacterium]|nr:TonB family protein [Chitinispirillaceae bacterium]
MAASLGFPTGSWPDPDEDEESMGGRILTLEEFMERLRNRPDIFGTEKSDRLRNTEVAALVVALLAGLWTTSVKTAPQTPDFFDEGPHSFESTVSMAAGGIERIREKSRAEVQKPPRPAVNDRKTIRHSKNSASGQGSQGTTKGTGSPFSHITGKGIIGILSQQIRGKDVAGDLFAKGGIAEGIDVILAGTNALKQGSANLVSRKGVEYIGHGSGPGSSGFAGPGPGGLGDWYDDLMAPQSAQVDLARTRGPPVDVRAKLTVIISGKSGQTTGGRSKMEIMRVVMQNLSALRHAYNQRLREKPGLKGRITVRFVIDEFGSVMYCEVVGSSMSDPVLEAAVTGKILRWRFERIDKPGDITEVVYPFVFST